MQHPGWLLLILGLALAGIGLLWLIWFSELLPVNTDSPAFNPVMLFRHGETPTFSRSTRRAGRNASAVVAM